MNEMPSIPGYDSLRLIGQNGHLVYLARHTSSGRLVQLNLVNSSGDFGRLVADHLRQQAALLSGLKHPNIRQVVEVGDAPAHGFFTALEYVGGGCLADKIRSGPLRPTEAVSLARTLATAIDYAREHSVVAFDLKPHSILLTEGGVPKLDDFRSLDSSPPEGFLVGSPDYMAPEEVSHSGHLEVTPATDVYRIGAVLYEMLTGQPPFVWSRDVEETIRRVVEQSPEEIRRRNVAVSPELAAICMRCLEKSPSSRFASPALLVNVLDLLPTSAQRTNATIWVRLWRHLTQA